MTSFDLYLNFALLINRRKAKKQKNMNKLTLSNFSFRHADAETQSSAIKSIEQARRVFGDSILLDALKKFNTDSGLHYEGVYVSFVENEAGCWALVLRERVPGQKMAGVYVDDTCTILLGLGYKIEVLTGESPLSDWGRNGDYIITDVDVSVVDAFKKSDVSHYGNLDSLIWEFKETQVWNEDLN